MQRLKIDAPLVGFLTDRAVLASGAALNLASWTKPAAEPELAAYIGKDLRPEAGRETTRAAIAALSPAIEVDDVDHPSDVVSGTLARNIYRRHVILGRKNERRAGGALEGLRCRIFRNGLEVVSKTDFEELTGELIAIVQHVANLLSHFDKKLEAGHLIVTGSITPPFWVTAGEQFAFELSPMDAISVRFTS